MTFSVETIDFVASSSKGRISPFIKTLKGSAWFLSLVFDGLQCFGQPLCSKYCYWEHGWPRGGTWRSIEQISCCRRKNHMVGFWSTKNTSWVLLWFQTSIALFAESVIPISVFLGCSLPLLLQKIMCAVVLLLAISLSFVVWFAVDGLPMIRNVTKAISTCWRREITKTDAHGGELIVSCLSGSFRL